MSISVIYVVANLDVGGTERHIAQVLPRLDRSLVKASVLTIINKGTLAADLEASGITVVGLNSGCQWQKLNKLQRIMVLIRGAGRLYTILRCERPDVVHFFLPMPYLLGGMVTLLAGVHARVMSRRSLNYYQLRYPGISHLEKWLHKRMTRVLGNSQAVLDDLRQEGVSEQQLGLIYNGVNIPVPQSPDEKGKVRQNIDVDKNDLLITIVANLIPYKGHDDLIRGLAYVLAELPQNWKLVCVGHDRHGIKNDLLTLSKELMIIDHVFFLGGRNDTVEILQASDVAVLCSHEEGFSNAVLEGMAASLPSVVTDVGGNSEAVRDGIDGYVIPRQSPEALGAAIFRLLDDGSLRKTMGESARSRVEEHFSVQACVREYEKMYMDVVAATMR
jgi:glycosyltransferase involved in cell wall biosynthesis